MSIFRKTFKIFFTTLLILFLSSCSNLLYYPTHIKYVSEKKLPIKPQEIKIPFEKKYITAWLFKASNTNKDIKKKNTNILFFHGNAQNISSHFISLYWILEHGYNFMIFDYPGYGISPGAPSPENTVSSGIAAWNWLQESFPNSSIAILGQSLGGAVAIRTVYEKKIKQSKKDNKQPTCLLTLDSTFLSYKKVGQDTLAKNWWSWIFQPISYLLLSDEWAPKSIAQTIGLPSIVIHSPEDPVVSFERGQEVFAQLGGSQKEFWTNKNGQHIDSFTGKNRLIFQKRYIDSLKKFCR